MTQDEIIRMAREAGSIDSEDVILTVYTAFAAHEREKTGKVSLKYMNQQVLAEREACAKVCEKIERNKWEIFTQGGKLEGLSPKDCAAAIRARKE